MTPRVAMKKKAKALHPWQVEARAYVKNSGIKKPTKRQIIQIIIDAALGKKP